MSATVRRSAWAHARRLFPVCPTGRTFQPATRNTPYAIISRDADSRVWECTNYIQDSSGDIVPEVQSFTELATGMCYQQNGQWVDSVEEIDISPQGGAQAVQGRHQVYFPSDIYSGAIQVVTPDGSQLQSRPVGISYFDGTNSVLIAELTNSTGQIISQNQVIYTNAFTDFAADLLCTYRKSGFECDLVFRSQIPAPESFGLNSASTRLQLLTEFFNTPAPVQTPMPVNPVTGLSDTMLTFGSMTMTHGKAFQIGTNAAPGTPGPGIPVAKTWANIEGRTILIEEVPMQIIAPDLQALPSPTTVSMTSPDPALYKVSLTRLLPPRRLAVGNMPALPLVRNKPVPVKSVAKAEFKQRPGFVLDYNLNSNQTNFTFQGDTTYVLSNNVFLGGTTTIEGGAVIKFGIASLDVQQVSCLTGPYRLAIFTSANDNSVGATVSGSTGIPTTLVGIETETNVVLQYIKFDYGSAAIYMTCPSVELWNCQFANCNEMMYVQGISFPIVKLHNDLIVGPDCAIEDNTGELNVRVDQITASVPYFVVWDDGAGNIYMTNSIIQGYLGTISITNHVLVTTSSNLFQTAGAGNYYLTNNSPYRGAGTTNIEAALLAELRQKTTYPPLIYTNLLVSTNLTLAPQAARDTNAAGLDYGYHYDPIDYLVDQFWITNATLSVTNGTVLAGYNDDVDVVVTDGSSIISVGTPLAPNWFTRYSSVQEQELPLGGDSNSPSSTTMINPYHATNEPAGIFRFTKFSTPAGGGNHLYHSTGTFAYSNLLVQDCEFWSGTNDFSGCSNTVAVLKNDLFVRSGINCNPATAFTNDTLAVSNCLFWNMGLVIRAASNSNTWFFFNNAFDNCTLNLYINPYVQNGYNAYLVNTNRLKPTNAFDIITTNDIAYEAGPLGTFYQPASSSLIGQGSCTGGEAGLYHYTTQTNQAIDGNSQVTIGYHYVALDSSGNPIDTNGDGIQDYLEDANGNGIYDTGDLGNWLISPYNGLSLSSGLQVFTPLK